MYAKFLVTSIIFTLALLPTAPQPAKALGCVNVDVSNQIKITGSKDAPGAQTNNVNQAIDPNCVGNAIVHKTNQVHVGSEGANQTRNSNQFSGGSGHPAIPASVMGAGNINFKSGTQTTIYNPALDPNFPHKR
jgi:hypothetical protein